MGALPSDHATAIDCAAEYLTRQGMTVLDRQWQPPGKPRSLDLAAVDPGHVFVVCDVTLCWSSGTAPRTCCGSARQRELRGLAMAWLQAHDARYDQLRIDAIRVCRASSGGFTIIYDKEVG
jgi:Holliday junction resolvase-like predicted endonuclease